MQKLTNEEAVSGFFALVEAERRKRPAAPIDRGEPETPEEAETRRFTCAEALLRAACPDPAHCSDQRCRRGGLCRHLGNLLARQQGRESEPATRRTPGADALRHAMWVYMNSLVAKMR